MKISKQKSAVNSYEVELSYGQLLAIHTALDKDHSDPMSDEMRMELGLYLDLLPRPGEEAGKGGEIVPQTRKVAGQGDVGNQPHGPGNIEDVDLDTELPHPDDEPSKPSGPVGAGEKPKEPVKDQGEEPELADMGA